MEGKTLRECVKESLTLHGQQLTKKSLHRLRDALLLEATYRNRSISFIAEPSNLLRKRPDYGPLTPHG